VNKGVHPAAWTHKPLFSRKLTYTSDMQKMAGQEKGQEKSNQIKTKINRRVS